MRDLTVSTRARSDTQYTAYEPQTHELYGRTFAHDIYGESHRYYLPVDDDEVIRQELGTLLWNWIHPPTFRWIQDVPEGVFLDLGTGSGTWVEEVSQSCPSRSIVGLDLFYPATKLELYPLCWLEVDNYAAIFADRGQPIALVHLRDSYFSLRRPREIAAHVFDALCGGGYFENEELRVEKMTSNKPKFNKWRQRVMASAQRLQIPLHSGQDLNTAFREAGFRTDEGRAPLTASRETELGASLFGYVILLVRASIRILVEGEPCLSADVSQFLDEVVQELEAEDCELRAEAEVLIACKPVAK